MLKGTSVLRENNKRRVLLLVRRLKQTTRQELMKEINVSKNTISLVVDELINDGVLEEVDIHEPRKKGRPKKLLQIKANSYKAIGITVSKWMIAYSVLNFNGELIEESSMNNDGTNAEKTIRFIVETLETLLERFNQVIGVGIGIPGIIDEKELKVPISLHLNWENVSLDYFSHLDVPISIQNSVNMGAHSAIHDEHLFDNESIFYVRVSEGVGGAYILDDIVISGETWTAGEIGHISVDAEAEKCRCGQSGCLESLINIEQFKNQLAQKNEVIIETSGFYRTDEHREVVTHLVEKFGRYLGKSLVSVVHLLNPKTVIIDTPYNKFDSFKDACLKYLETHCLSRVFNGTMILFSEKRYGMSRGAALSTIISYEKQVF